MRVWRKIVIPKCRKGYISVWNHALSIVSILRILVKRANDRGGFKLGFACLLFVSFLVQMRIRSLIGFYFWSLMVHKGFKPGFACFICASFLVQMRIRSLIEFCFWSLMVHKFCNNVDSPNILLVLDYEWKLSSLLLRSKKSQCCTKAQNGTENWTLLKKKKNTWTCNKEKRWSA